MGRVLAAGRRSSWLVWAKVLAASAIVAASGQGRSLLLLTGTCLNDNGETFPVRLYTVDRRHKLNLVREVVPGSEGLYEVLDDTGDKIYVAYPFKNRTAPTSLSIIHKEEPWQSDVVTFNPKATFVWSKATATAAGVGLQSYALFAVAPGSSPSISQLLRGATLESVAGDAPAQGPRVRLNDWSLYEHPTFYGSPGGPGIYFTPQAEVENGRLVMHLGGESIFIDRAPPSLVSGKTVRILAANRRFLVCSAWGRDSTEPASLYVHKRGSETWRTLNAVGSKPECRIFGYWLATIVRGSNSGVGQDDNPGHSDESDHWVKDLLPNVREEFEACDSSFYLPGEFVLDNLADGTRVTLRTGEEDSEILAVRSDGALLYRVNDSIFSAQIEGGQLSAPSLVVKDDDVPEVHWVFWSNAKPNVSPGPHVK